MAPVQDVFTQLVLHIVSTPTTVPQWHVNAPCALSLVNSTHTRLVPPTGALGYKCSTSEGLFFLSSTPLTKYYKSRPHKLCKRWTSAEKLTVNTPLRAHCHWFSTLLRNVTNNCYKLVICSSHMPPPAPSIQLGSDSTSLRNSRDFHNFYIRCTTKQGDGSQCHFKDVPTLHIILTHSCWTCLWV